MNKHSEYSTIFISGYARLPEGITATELYKVIALGVLVDTETGKITEADCSLITSVSKKLVSEILVGKLVTDINSIEGELTARYHGSAKKALIAAMRMIHLRFQNLEEEVDDE